MEEKKIKTNSGNILMFRSIISIMFGLGFIFWPGFSFFELVYFFTAYAGVDGLLAMTASITLQKNKYKRPSIFFWEGLLSFSIALIIGISFYLWPDMEHIYFIYGVISWAFITGLVELLGTFSVKWEKTSKIFMGVNSALSIMLGLILLIIPFPVIFHTAYILGGYALLFGLFLFLHGMDMGKYFKETK